MAVLAAAAGRKVADVAGAMVRIREVIDPRPERTGCSATRTCGWSMNSPVGLVRTTVAQHAYQRAV